MLYAVICKDKPGALQTRLDTRAAHLAYIETTGLVKMAGPFLEEGQMCGSLVILDCDSLDAARAWASGRGETFRQERSWGREADGIQPEGLGQARLEALGKRAAIDRFDDLDDQAPVLA